MLKNSINLYREAPELKTLQDYVDFFLPHIGKIYMVKEGSKMDIYSIISIEQNKVISVIGDNGQYLTKTTEVTISHLSLNTYNSTVIFNSIIKNVDCNRLYIGDRFFLFHINLQELTPYHIQLVKELKLNVLNEIETLYDKICK